VVSDVLIDPDDEDRFVTIEGEHKVVKFMALLDPDDIESGVADPSVRFVARIGGVRTVRLNDIKRIR
jgi:hypothetical protein